MNRFLVLIAIIGFVMVGCGGEEQTPAPTPTQTIVLPTATTVPSPTTVLTPTPTPCAPNTEWEDTYTVQSGDTLGAIAIASGVSVEALQEGNCLTDSDFIDVGAVLVVPNSIAVDIATSPIGLDGLVLFIREDSDGARNIWAVKSDGTSPRQLTEHEMVVGRPVRTIDYEWVAYRVLSPFAETTASDIWLMHADGIGLFELAEQGPTEQLVRSDPTWSPDNDQLAYVEQVADRGSLIMINRDGTGRRVVSVGDFTSPDTDQPTPPAWSPDGLKIAFLEWVNNRSTLKSIDTETLEITSHDPFISYEDGPLWVPFDGDNGEPAVAVQVTEAGQPVWKVINLTNGDTVTRIGGRVLVAPSLDWWIDENGRLWSAEYIPQEMNVPDGTTWGPGNNQLVVPTDEGLLLLEIGKDGEHLITQEDTDLMPVWSEPLYFILP